MKKSGVLGVAALLFALVVTAFVHYTRTPAAEPWFRTTVPVAPAWGATGNTSANAPVEDGEKPHE
jgi:hypothetical protein